MIGSLYSGISGLKANTDAMSVIGDNIANVNTTGFKSSKASFADVLSGVTGKEIGQGVIMSGQKTDWTQGAPESTGNATDLAITGDGLFVVRDSAGAIHYTRVGNFQFDNAGNLVTHDDMIVQGYEIDPATGTLGAVGNITITSGNSQPLVTSEMSVNLNLNVDDTNGLDESVGAVLTVAGNPLESYSDVTYTAVKGGAEGNNISVEYTTAGTELTVSVAGDVITVDFALGSPPTAAEIAEFINTDPSAGAVAARALVTVTTDGDGDGTIVNAAAAAVSLVGGGGAAAVTVDGAGAGNDDITYTAVTGGTAGNDIKVVHVGTAGTPLEVIVVGDVITVKFNSSNVPSASDVATAINTNVDAALLVSASAEGDGSGDVANVGIIALTGGVEVSDNTPDVYSNTITVYDSKGSAVDVTAQYTCIGQGRWVWDMNPSDGSSSSTGVISFDENGKLSYPVTNPTIEITGLSNGAEDLAIEWDLVNNDNFTGYALLSSTSSQTQNGYAAGTLQGVSVDNEGFVVNAYSNGKLIPGYRVALADFSSYDGLFRTGNNLYSESLVSGQPTFGTPGSGSLGIINSRSLEMSNVDLATEFVRMITTQRAFQASSRVITTSDEILQELINLKR